MLTFRTTFLSLFSLFIIGVIVGAAIIFVLFLKRLLFKHKYGFSDPAILNIKDMNPREGSTAYGSHKDTVDGSGALKDFKRE